jgi:hypothetical protein
LAFAAVALRFQARLAVGNISDFPAIASAFKRHLKSPPGIATSSRAAAERLGLSDFTTASTAEAALVERENGKKKPPGGRLSFFPEGNHRTGWRMAAVQYHT